MSLANDRGRPDLVTLFLAGDVMTGRGIDQVLRHPGNARLYEPYVQSALTYVELAERRNGPVPRAVPDVYVWGDALGALERRRPDVLIVNLETAVTRSGRPEPKQINYRMNPDNTGVLTAPGLDFCGLANNHVLDWGPDGLSETLHALDAVGVAHAGAGRNRADAEAPAVMPHRAGGRVLVFAFGAGSSGIASDWAATDTTAGVAFVPDLSEASLRRIAEAVQAAKRSRDIVVASIHWGPNWGYDIGSEEAAFAHRLIDDAGVDVVHGHSSHHAKGVEVYRDHLILYGCGDFLNDYEGIDGHEACRGDLAVAYFPVVRAADGTLDSLTMSVFQLRRFRLNRASESDVEWLRRMFSREGARLGTSARSDDEGNLILSWDDGHRAAPGPDDSPR